MPVNASRPRLCPRFVQVVARPKFVGCVDVVVSVVCMGAPGRVESLSHSEDVSFDEDSVGASNKLRAEGWNVRIECEMLTWTGDGQPRVVQTLFQLQFSRTFTRKEECMPNREYSRVRVGANVKGCVGGGGTLVGTSALGKIARYGKRTGFGASSRAPAAFEGRDEVPHSKEDHFANIIYSS